MSNGTFLVLALCILIILAGVVVAIVKVIFKAGSSVNSALKQKERNPQRYGVCTQCKKADVVYLVTDKKSRYFNSEFCEECYKELTDSEPTK